MARAQSLEAVLQTDRMVVAAGLIVLAGLGWLALGYEAFGAGRCMDAAMRMSTVSTSGWQLRDLVLLFSMWAVMMVAMMVPSVAPTVLTFALVNRKRHEQQRPFVPTGFFLIGYLTAWTVFSLLATVIQQTLHAAALLSPAMVLTSPMVGGGVLIAAGVFQLTPLKRACLVHCRTPLRLLMTEWREGAWGAFLMGWKNGHYCIGCCWLLMALLFVAGVMNIAWVAVISAFVLAEKVMPVGPRLGWAAGLACIAWGVWMASSPLVHTIWQSL